MWALGALEDPLGSTFGPLGPLRGPSSSTFKPLWPSLFHIWAPKGLSSSTFEPFVPFGPVLPPTPPLPPPTDELSIPTRLPSHRGQEQIPVSAKKMLEVDMAGH